MICVPVDHLLPVEGSQSRRQGHLGLSGRFRGSSVVKPPSSVLLTFASLTGFYPYDWVL